jgi:DNA-binding GntR family transcriptional regulator
VTQADLATLTADTGLEIDRVREALGTLEADGLVGKPDRGRYAVVD